MTEDRVKELINEGFAIIMKQRPFITSDEQDFYDNTKAAQVLKPPKKVRTISHLQDMGYDFSEKLPDPPKKEPEVSKKWAQNSLEQGMEIKRLTELVHTFESITKEDADKIQELENKYEHCHKEHLWALKTNDRLEKENFLLRGLVKGYEIADPILTAQEKKLAGMK